MGSDSVIMRGDNLLEFHVTFMIGIRNLLYGIDEFRRLVRYTN